MKKVVLSFAVVAAAMLASCGETANNSQCQNAADSAAAVVDSAVAVVDSTVAAVVDSAAAVVENAQ